jgi:hypothetical protein
VIVIFFGPIVINKIFFCRLNFYKVINSDYFAAGKFNYTLN